MFYSLTIGLSMIIIAVFNIIFNVFDLKIWYILLAVVLSTIAVIAIDGIFALIIRRLMPKKWFSYKKKVFSVSKKELKFYDFLQIRKWKDKVPEWGQFTNFHKDKLNQPLNIEYLERFLLESNYGYIIHIVDMFVGFLVIFVYPLKFWACFGLYVAIVNAVLNYLPACILRYNTPRLEVLLKINLARKARSEKQAQSVENA